MANHERSCCADVVDSGVFGLSQHVHIRLYLARHTVVLVAPMIACDDSLVSVMDLLSSQQSACYGSIIAQDTDHQIS